MKPPPKAIEVEIAAGIGGGRAVDVRRPVGTFSAAGSSAIAPLRARPAHPVSASAFTSATRVSSTSALSGSRGKRPGAEPELTTVDASAFPDDLLRLTCFQDDPSSPPDPHVPRQPPRGARSVKVCLGDRVRTRYSGDARVLARDQSGASHFFVVVAPRAAGGRFERRRPTPASPQV